MMRKNQWLVYFPQRAIILFIILNLCAMITYSGGTLHQAQTTAYSFTHNFLSDLGRFNSWDGSNNFYATLFFNSSMIITGFVLSLFFIHIRNLFNFHNNFLYWFSILGTISGIGGGCSMIGVALTPSDLYLEQHIIFANWIFRFFFISAICYTFIIYNTDLVEKKYAIGYCVFAGLIFFYIIISEFGPSADENMPALILQVVAQKSILFCFLISIYIQTRGLDIIINGHKK